MRKSEWVFHKSREISLALEGVPGDQWLSEMAQRVETTPEEDRRAVEIYLLGGVEGGESVQQGKEGKIAFYFSLVLMLISLVFVVFVPQPTPRQWYVLKVDLALAGAGFAAFLPGAVEVDVKGQIKAAGALAIFVIIFLGADFFVS